MESYLRSIGEVALEEGQKKGVQVETYLLHDRELSIEVADAKVETLKQADETGMGIRVIKDGRLGFAFTSDLSLQAVKSSVQDAINISAYTAADEYNQLPAKVNTYPEVKIYDTETASMSLQDKIQMAMAVEQAARQQDQRIRIIERSGYDDMEYCTLIMNSQGLYAYEKGNFSGIYIFLVAEEDEDAQNGFSMMTARSVRDLFPARVGEEAARNALRALNARSIQSGQIPVILDPYVSTRFSAIVASMVNAESVQKGKSMFQGKMGQKVASSLCTIVDDALMKGGIATSKFDGEGTATSRNVLVEKGVLKTFLYDHYTALKGGGSSTGNGNRGSFRSLPSVASSNFLILPGQQSPETMRAGIEKGLYITEVMGMHTANPISGDFSVGAAGIMIEKGELTYPVRGATIAGNMSDFLQNIDAVGTDMRFYGAKGAPSLRLKHISIGGES